MNPTSVNPGTATSTTITDIIAGLAVFASMSYVVFAIPIILSDAGFPTAPVFYATCLAAILASVFSAWYARAPAALAPGVGVCAVMAQLLTAGQHPKDSHKLEYKDLPALALKLKSPTNAMASFLRSKLSSESLSQLSGWTDTKRPISKALSESLEKDIQALLRGPSIYSSNLFSSGSMRSGISHLVALNPHGSDLTRLNRLLLEEGFREEIVPLPERSSNYQTVPWESAMLALACAGLILFGLSITKLRREFIDRIPHAIIHSVTAGIGAVIAKEALSRVQVRSDYLLFAVGLFIIWTGYSLLPSLALRLKSPRTIKTYLHIGRLGFFASVLTLAIMSRWTSSSATGTPVVSPDGTWLWLEVMHRPPGSSFRDISARVVSPMVFYLLFVLLIDIVGSPYHMALDEGRDQTNKFAPATEKKIRRAFIVDSMANLVAPILGTGPVVYYAENLAGRVLDGRGPLVAVVPAVLFGALGAIGFYVMHVTGGSLESYIPPVAVAPAMFVIGMIIVSKSILPGPPRATTSAAESNKGTERPTDEWIRDHVHVGCRLPAALAVIITPAHGFEIGVAVGLVVYGLFCLLLPEGHFEEVDRDRSFAVWMGICAVFLLAFRFF